MLVQEGEGRSSAADRHLAWTLAGVAGALNTAGFYAVGFYSSNMTGNVSALADHLGIGDLATAGPYLAVVVTFVAGATVSTLMINAGRRHLAGIYAISILVEALLMAALGCAALWLPEMRRGPTLAFGLSFLMGLQNAVVTRISNARVRTTHVTGMVTDIGIELANALDLAGRRGQEAEAAANRERLWLHGQTVLAFLGGGVVGVATFRAAGVLLLFGTAAVLLAISGFGLVTGWRGAPPDTTSPGRLGLQAGRRPGCGRSESA